MQTTWYCNDNGLKQFVQIIGDFIMRRVCVEWKCACSCCVCDDDVLLGQVKMRPGFHTQISRQFCMSFFASWLIINVTYTWHHHHHHHHHHHVYIHAHVYLSLNNYCKLLNFWTCDLFTEDKASMENLILSIVTVIIFSVYMQTLSPNIAGLLCSSLDVDCNMNHLTYTYL